MFRAPATQDKSEFEGLLPIDVMPGGLLGENRGGENGSTVTTGQCKGEWVKDGGGEWGWGLPRAG